MEDRHIYYPQRGWYWKWVWACLLFMFAGWMMLGCAKEGEPVEVKNGGDDFKVERLFEVHGCTVFRFYDIERHYFVACEGKVIKTGVEYYQCGKALCTKHLEETISTSMR